MTRPWLTLERAETPDGLLELRRRGDGDFLICLDGRVLMNSRQSRSEEVLGTRTCAGLPRAARVLIGGLGMGLTLRAVLPTLSSEARVVVAELHAVVRDWASGPLATLNDHVLDDDRVEVVLRDVAGCIEDAAQAGGVYHAIAIDLFEGPHAGTDARSDPLYGTVAIERTWCALAKGGVLGVWVEAPDRGFEARLRRRGFRVETVRPGRGGLRHSVVLARRP